MSGMLRLDAAKMLDSGLLQVSRSLLHLHACAPLIVDCWLRWFDNLVLAIVMLNSISLACDDPTGAAGERGWKGRVG